MQRFAASACAVLSIVIVGGAESYIEVSPGIRLFVRDEGRGRPVVVLHGGPGLDMNYLAPGLEPLTKRHRLIFYDQRGTGRSTVVDDVTAGLLVDDLEAVRKHYGFERLTLVGHSWGAGLAALYAMSYADRVQRLALLGPSPVRAAGLKALTDNLTSRLTPEELSELEKAAAARGQAATEDEHVATCRAFWSILAKAYYADPRAASLTPGDTCAPPGAALGNAMRVNQAVWRSLGDFDWRGRLGSIRVPTLVIHGDMDPIPLDSAREWRTAIPASRLLIVKDAGHMTYEEQPDIFFAALGQFLNGRWPAGAE